MKILSWILSLAVLTGCATARPEVGVAADATSTAIALSTPNTVEFNPLGWMTIPIRLIMLDHARSLPPEEGVPQAQAIEASSWGAAMNNLMVAAGAGPAGVVVGIITTALVWEHGARERDFWTTCAVNKLVAPDSICEYKDVQ